MNLARRMFPAGFGGIFRGGKRQIPCDNCACLRLSLHFGILELTQSPGGKSLWTSIFSVGSGSACECYRFVDARSESENTPGNIPQAQQALSTNVDRCFILRGLCFGVQSSWFHDIHFRVSHIFFVVAERIQEMVDVSQYRPALHDRCLVSVREGFPDKPSLGVIENGRS